MGLGGGLQQRRRFWPFGEQDDSEEDARKKKRAEAKKRAQEEKKRRRSAANKLGGRHQSNKNKDELPFETSKKQSWDKMADAVQAQWEALGWTRESWDKDDGPKPASALAPWSALNESQKTVARLLGYDEVKGEKS
jgi:hypothetical protein